MVGYIPFAVKLESAEVGRREKKSLHFEISRNTRSTQNKRQSEYIYP